jgi:hypothetical protein
MDHRREALVGFVITRGNMSKRKKCYHAIAKPEDRIYQALPASEPEKKRAVHPELAGRQSPEGD